RESGDVALHVRHEHGDAEARESLREHHERHGLSRPRRSRHETVAIAVLGPQIDGVVALADQDLSHRRPARVAVGKKTKGRASRGSPAEIWRRWISRGRTRAPARATRAAVATGPS